eukprot:TRINITY_DN1417_c0_g1_i2.p1 TRINITY_DN1417_c0_g1~~TRINITY_DN1417_c0_g1_i2.p1  ORF type:complete len:694 (+),score=240.01 TRINITY_DN1417_c0_g1_i2:79-2160(+)
MAKLFIIALLSVFLASDGFKISSHKSQGGPVAEVVTLLKEMLDKSKADAAEEAKLFATFKDYCDTQDREKTKSIEDLTNSIAMLNSRIEELTGTAKRLNKELKDLAEELSENRDAQKEADAIRAQTEAEYEAAYEEMMQMIAALEEAIDHLSTVQDPNALLLSLGLSLDKSDSKIFKNQRLQKMFEKSMAKSKTQKSKAFLEVPTKSESQSGQVFGVIRSVLDNTKTALEEWIMYEHESVDNHDHLMETLTRKEKSMSDSEAAKQAELADTEAELATRQGELEADTKQKEDDETFHANLIADCKEKTRINNERLALRRGENEAIQTALEILDSDRGAKIFGKVDATSFIQTSSHQSRNDASTAVMSQVLHLLRHSAHELHSSRLAEVAALTIPRNPFNRVLKAIVEMKAQIKDEEKADKKQFNLCKKQRAEGAAEVAEKNEQINELNMAMDTLDATMKEPENGLKDTIKREESELEENQKTQKDETTTRREENEEYQTNIKNLVIAQQMLQESINVLQAYYEEMASHPLNSFLQVQSNSRNADAPEVSQGAYTGQNQKVIGMIEGVLKETADEESLAHKSEGAAQQAFEDSMTLLTKQEASLRKSIEENKVALATAEQDYISREKERDSTEADLAAVESFLHEIKPTCDFMEANYENRKASREKEDGALDKATGLIKNSPAYVAAEQKANSQR